MSDPVASNPPFDRGASIEPVAPTPTAARYVLRLYVTGMTRISTRAIENVRAICEEHLEGRYNLEIVDIRQQPVLTKLEQIIAAPTLIKKLPLPSRRIIGDMSHRDRVLVALDLIPDEDTDHHDDA